MELLGTLLSNMTTSSVSDMIHLSFKKLKKKKQEDISFPDLLGNSWVGQVFYKVCFFNLFIFKHTLQNIHIYTLHTNIVYMHTQSVHKHIYTHYLHTHRIHLFIYAIHVHLYTHTTYIHTYTFIYIYIYVYIYIYIYI